MMVYVALLRGINVGGKNKVEMPKLQATFERLGFAVVKTYINSGNVIFTAAHAVEPQEIEIAIEKEFGFAVPTLVRTLSEIELIVSKIPAGWKNDAQMKCDVMFLWQGLDNREVLKRISHKPEIEDVMYVPGAIVWRIDRQNVNRGGLLKIIGTDVYKQMTVRNVNTARKLYELMKAA